MNPWMGNPLIQRAACKLYYCKVVKNKKKVKINQEHFSLSKNILYFLQCFQAVNTQLRWVSRRRGSGQDLGMLQEGPRSRQDPQNWPLLPSAHLRTQARSVDSLRDTSLSHCLRHFPARTRSQPLTGFSMKWTDARPHTKG